MPHEPAQPLDITEYVGGLPTPRQQQVQATVLLIDARSRRERRRRRRHAAKVAPLVAIFWALDNTIWRRYGNGGPLRAALRRALDRRAWHG